VVSSFDAAILTLELLREFDYEYDTDYLCDGVRFSCCTRFKVSHLSRTKGLMSRATRQFNSQN